VGTSRLERTIVVDLNQLGAHDANLSGLEHELAAPGAGMVVTIEALTPNS
jgi:hypothetical protein